MSLMVHLTGIAEASAEPHLARVRPRPFLARTWLVFAALFSVLLLWSAAVPIYGTPDEPAHMVRAAGIVRGQVDGDRAADGVVTYEVPAVLASERVPCYAFRPQRTADCLVIPPDIGDIAVASTASGYPPLFHALVGWPTLVTSGLESLYLMRVANALVCALLLTAAVVNLRRLPRPAPIAVGMMVSLTPMVLFLSGPVNPSGMAASAGLAIWTAGLVLLGDDSSRRLRHATAAFGIPFCVLILIRRDSLLWGLAILVMFAVLISWDRLRVLVRSPAAWLWTAAIAVTALVQYVVWSGDAASSFAEGAEVTSGGNASAALGDTFEYLRQAVGKMGWLDTSMPTVVYLGWLLVVGVLLLSMAKLGRKQEVFAVAVAVVMLVGLITIVGSVRYPYLQGRYFLPFAVGVPLIAGHALSQARISRVPPRLLAIGVGTVFVLHQVSFAQQLRRHAVGTRGSWFFAFDNEWSPDAAPIWLLMAGYFVATGAMLAMLVAIMRSSGGRSGTAPAVAHARAS